MKRSLLLTTAALGIAIAPLGAVHAEGLFIGANVGLSGGHFNVWEDDLIWEDGGSVNGLSGGIIVGADLWRSGPWWGGIRAEWNAANITGAGSELIDACAECWVDYRINSIGRFSGRVGNGPLYGYAGVSVATFGVYGGLEDWDYMATRVGGHVGLGAQTEVAPSVVVFVDGVFDFFPRRDEAWGGEPYGSAFNVVTGRVGAVVYLDRLGQQQ